ncbi:hypothetical protein HYH03_015300 [Edaphochlamys debaryana]|uniref:BTB domain-containing protein n=1 Tax=Edaphochlamys debaryana TaxID=47281 RepID=A0A835XMD4_9CHLO|nr:hypothetical protein HYH03_015300 [Edaphochlamys debaryana]|eukprot:KAG2485977.1 hypothetical protein HYH03_015300 [Edaphochlamys debaryana]
MGEPMPAHTWVLQPGSSFFKSQLERWTAEQPPGSKPVLRVPLGSSEDVPHARTAIRYIYTGELGTSSAADIQGARRLACYLGVEGAAEACSMALVDLARPDGQHPLDGIADLFTCRHLLPASDEDPRAASLLDDLRSACQLQLMAYKGAGTEFSAPCGAKVPLGGLLAWAFPDAPSVLSNRGSKGRVLFLSASSLEALLSSDAFATDNEASVLLLLAEWLNANRVATALSADVCPRLCRFIRLCQLSSVYLHGLLHLLPWFPLTAPELPLLRQAATLPEGAARDHLLAYVADGGFDWPPAWTSGAARPHARADAGEPYIWSIAQEDLSKSLAANEIASIQSTLTDSCSALVANGFEVWPMLQLHRDHDAAGVYLELCIPAALRAQNVPPLLGVSSPGACRLMVLKWTEGGDGPDAEPAYCHECDGPDDVLGIGRAWGRADALPLPEPVLPEDGTAPDPLARWKPYLHAGRLRGILTWLGPEEEEPEEEEEEAAAEEGQEEAVEATA